MTTPPSRCPYKYYDNLTGNFSWGDNQCLLNEGHIGEHVKREILPKPQPVKRVSGWFKE